MPVYKSKIGLELVIPISFVLTGCAVLMATERSWSGLLIILLVAAGIGWIHMSIEYRIDGDHFTVHCGGLRYRPIDIHSILEIKKSRDPISSPAGSLDRIAIVYEGSKKILISPKQKSELIKKLLEINPTIKTDRL